MIKFLYFIIGFGFGDMLYYHMTGDSFLHGLVLHFANVVFKI